MLEFLQSIPEIIWGIIKFIANILSNILSAIFTVLKNIVNQTIGFYFNIINTIFNSYPIPFIFIVAVAFAIFYIVWKYYFKSILNEKIIFSFLAIFFFLVPLIIVFVGYTTKSSIPIDNNEKLIILKPNKLKFKDKNISKKEVNPPIDISKLINHKIMEQNKVFEKKLQLEQAKYNIKIESLKQTIQSLHIALVIIEKRLYAHDNDFSFYSREIKTIKQNINNKTKDNNLSTK